MLHLEVSHRTLVLPKHRLLFARFCTLFGTLNIHGHDWTVKYFHEVFLATTVVAHMSAAHRHGPNSNPVAACHWAGIWVLCWAEAILISTQSSLFDVIWDFFSAILRSQFGEEFSLCKGARLTTRGFHSAWPAQIVWEYVVLCLLVWFLPRSLMSVLRLIWIQVCLNSVLLIQPLQTFFCQRTCRLKAWAPLFVHFSVLKRTELWFGLLLCIDCFGSLAPLMTCE